MKLADKFGMIRSSEAHHENLAPSVNLDFTAYHSIKSKVHSRLIDLVDFSTIEDIPEQTLREWIRDVARDVSTSENMPLNRKELDTLVSDVVDEILGLGPIEPLLKDDSIQDILVNTHKQV